MRKSRENGLFLDVPAEQWNDWHWQVAHRVETLDELKKYIKLPPEEEEGVATTLGKLRMAITPYYLSLIDLNDPYDPIRKQAIPTGHELALAELTDQLNELRINAAKGKEALKERSGLLDEIERAKQTEKNLRDEIRDLENRPIATVKERDEQAIEEAVQKAKAAAAVEWSDKTAKLTQELEKAKAAADKLKAKADKADAGAAEKVAAAEAEAEKLRRELEAARKAAKLSDANVTAFSIHFKAFQETAQALFAALGKIADADISTAAKLADGVEQLFSRYKTQTGEIKERAAKAPLPGQTEMGG